MKSTSYIEHKARVLKYIYPYVVKDVDGYYVWLPTPGGALTGGDTLMIAALLFEANRLWDIEVLQYFIEDQIRTSRSQQTNS